MTDTVVSSATREVVIGFDRPFVIIGERINPTGRKILAAEMAAGDFTRVTADAIAQVDAGAHMRTVKLERRGVPGRIGTARRGYAHASSESSRHSRACPLSNGLAKATHSAAGMPDATRARSGLSWRRRA